MDAHEISLLHKSAAAIRQSLDVLGY